MVSAIDIQAHFSSHYKPRTLVNAAQADLTVAFALDYDSPGERLTRKAAGERYAAIPLGADPLESARALYRHLRANQVRRLNVAGNGLSTLSRHGWTQARTEDWLYEVLAKAALHWPLEVVRSGGQTGVDIAALSAAHALGIPVVGLLPKGFRQRLATGEDVTQTASVIREQIITGARRLQRSQAREC